MVYFVGAGPGAKDLITVRGMRLLEQADVIIYAGSLVNPELLSYAGSGAKIYDSAKMTLEEVLAVIREAEKKGLTTVQGFTPGSRVSTGRCVNRWMYLQRRGFPMRAVPASAHALARRRI